MGLMSATKFAAALVAFAVKWKGTSKVENKYSAIKTLVKAAVAFGITLASGVVLAVLQVFDAIQLPDSWDGLKAGWPMLAMSAGAAILQAVLNWYKNKDNGK